MKKYKYIVSINTINFNSDGKVNSKSFDYEFTEGTILDMRNDAFDRVNDMINFFENEMSSDQQFDSPLVAKQKKYTNTNGYSISVFFYIDDYDYQIFGDEDLEVEGFEAEAQELKEYLKVA